MTTLTVSTVCFRAEDLSGALATANRLGFSAVDLGALRGLCEHVPVNGSRVDRQTAARVMNASGLRAASVNADPGSFDGQDDPVEVRRRVSGLLEFCEEVGAPQLVLPCGEKTDNRARPPAFGQMADALNDIVGEAGRRGVQLTVEAPYFGRPVDDLSRTGEFAQLLAPEVLLAFDVSHVVAAGDLVSDGWSQCAERVGIVHLRDAVLGNIRRVIGAGEVDFAALFDIAFASGYRGDWVLELETRDSPFVTKEQEVLDAVERLQPLLGEAASTHGR